MPALKNPRHEAFAQAHARGMSASAAEENAVLIKKPEKTIKRDEMGRFDRHGKTLAKTQKKSGLINKSPDNQKKPDGRLKNGGVRSGAGRPKGSPNKLSHSLKEMILAALDEVGGKQYLARLAVENSSAFGSLLGKVLPTTLQASDSDGGKSTGIEFTRIIVHPGGHKEIEGVTPKQLPPPTPIDPKGDGSFDGPDGAS